MSIVSGSLGAVMGSNATENAAQTSADAQKSAAQTAADVQREMYYRALGEYAPYSELGRAAAPMLQSAVMGGPVTAPDSAYTQLSPADIAAYNKQQQDLANQSVQDYNAAHPGIEYRRGGETTFVGPLMMGTSANGQQFNIPTSAKAQLAANGTYYKGPNGEIVSSVPNKTYEFNPQESPAAKYELQQGTKALNRQLAARGLLNSGNAAQRLSELSSGVAANDYNQQYGRLLDMVKVGSGASGSAGAASQNTGNSLAGIQQQLGAGLSNSALASGQARASLYSGLGGASANTVGAGLKAYNYGQQAGWWGNGGTAYDAGGANFAGNTAGSGAVDNYGALLAE